ncbi:MAG: NAD(+) diphosphatase [Croceibacterium sp.]
MIPFAGFPLDRADEVRNDPARLATLRADGLLLKMDGLAPDMADDGLATEPLGASDGELVFLGLREGRALFAQVPAEGNVEPAYAQRSIWELLGVLSADDLALYGTARSVLDWHARHRFCARCGARTALAKGGWQRDCPGCGATHFPRVDPVAIMLVEHPQGSQLLLGRNARFPPGSYSALAGFLEPGETIEEGVAREVMEEAGVAVRDVRYVASQPWPFPSQLMIGCHAVALSEAITIDRTELEDARWFPRAEIAEAMEAARNGWGTSAGFRAPTARAIAHYLLRWWLEQSE